MMVLQTAHLFLLLCIIEVEDLNCKRIQRPHRLHKKLHTNTFKDIQ